MRYRVLALFAIAILSGVLLFGRAGGVQPSERDAKAHSFGDIVLYVVSKPKDSKSESTYVLIDKPTVIRLGERFFIVGSVPAYGDDEAAKEAAGKRLWVPESEVVQMTEFKSLAEARKYFDTARNQADKEEK